jgi:glutaredoxin 3
MWWATWVCGRSTLANGHGGETPRESANPGPILIEVVSRITVYTTEPCGYCRVAKALLAKRNVPYEEINLAKDPEGRAELVRKTGMMTFPQVVIDGESIGGYQELVAADRSGRLRDFSEAAA